LISPEGYAFSQPNPEGVPIEDYGDYILTEEKVPAEKAWELFLAKLPD